MIDLEASPPIDMSEEISDFIRDTRADYGEMFTEELLALIGERKDSLRFVQRMRDDLIDSKVRRESLGRMGNNSYQSEIPPRGHVRMYGEGVSKDSISR